MTVCCVLRSGGRYDGRWVRALREGVSAHLDAPYRFVCLTDDAGFRDDHMPGPRTLTFKLLPFRYDWPGWWSKIEICRPGLFDGPVLYVDLDSAIVGDLSALARYDGDLALLSDFNAPERAQSGVMLFTPGLVTAALWRVFTASPERHIAEYRGDGEWLHKIAGTKTDRIDRLYPGAVVSYKHDVRPNGDRLPDGAKIVAFHGVPKQDDFNWRMPWER